MAIKQLVPIEITLVGDGSSTTFVYPLVNMYQNGTGSSFPVGGVGVVPSSITVSNTPVAVTSATIDSNGNITITLTSALGNNVQATMEVDLFYSSGAITSSSSNPTQAVNIQSSGTALTNTGGALNISGPVQTGNAPTFATVGVTSATALAANSSRTAVILTNTSTNTIYLGFGANAAVVGSGVVLFPNSSLLLDAIDNIQQAITAIASGSSSNLAIQEFN